MECFNTDIKRIKNIARSENIPQRFKGICIINLERKCIFD